MNKLNQQKVQQLISLSDHINCCDITIDQIKLIEQTLIEFKSDCNKQEYDYTVSYVVLILFPFDYLIERFKEQIEGFYQQCDDWNKASLAI